MKASLPMFPGKRAHRFFVTMFPAREKTHDILDNGRPFNVIKIVHKESCLTSSGLFAVFA